MNVRYNRTTIHVAISHTAACANIRLSIAPILFVVLSIIYPIVSRLPIYLPMMLHPFDNIDDDATVLILGDGNLSFACAFALANTNLSITATVFESRDELIERYYPIAESSLQTLSTMKHVNVQFEVDATNLIDDGNGYDHIIMNFPHPGCRTNLRRCRLLLRNIFDSIRRQLANSGKFHLTLTKNQSGLKRCANSDDDQLLMHNKDSWQTIYIAADFGFVIESIAPFNSSHFVGYTCTGYLNRNRSFHQIDAETLTFGQLPMIQDDDDYVIDNDELIFIDELHHSIPFYRHDVSFWLLQSNDDNDRLNVIRTTVIRLSSGLIKKVIPLLHLSYRCEYSQRLSVVYRLVWQSRCSCLCRRVCNQLQDRLRMRLANLTSIDQFPFELR